MAEYIESEALTIENLEKYMTVMEVNTKEYGQQVVVAVDDLMYLPTADVAEVRHGKWLNNYKSGTLVNEGFVSSCCDMWNERKSSFCPNCGAKME